MTTSIQAGDATLVFLQPGIHYSVRCFNTTVTFLSGSCFINGIRVIPGAVIDDLTSLDSQSRVSINATGNVELTGSVREEITSKCPEISCDLPITDEVGAVIKVELNSHDLSKISNSFLRSTYKRLWVDSKSPPLVKLDYFELYASLAKAVTITSDWSSPLADLRPSTVLRVAVCGPKNAGKSTLCKYLVNTLLSRSKSVLYLETDLGQSEVTPPGLVTLTLLKQPLFSPPYTNRPLFVRNLALSHPHGTSESYCVGPVSPAQVMEEYISKLQVLVERAKRLCSEDVPLVINNMGWTKGFGVALHADILRMAEPSHVFNLVTNSPKDLPPIMDVISTPGISSEEEITPITPPQVINIPGYSSSEPVMQGQGFQPFELRHLSLLNYFSPIYGPQHNKILPPYRISWKHVAVVIPEETDNTLTAYTLNCSVVALLTGPPNVLPDSDETIKVVEDDPAMKCLGLGIIRAVDVKSGVFFLNTPLDKQTLEQVFVFRHTSLPVPHLPSGILPMPYVSNLAASETLGMGSRSQRANLKRRYQAIAQN